MFDAYTERSREVARRMERESLAAQVRTAEEHRMNAFLEAVNPVVKGLYDLDDRARGYTYREGLFGLKREPSNKKPFFGETKNIVYEGGVVPARVEIYLARSRIGAGLLLGLPDSDFFPVGAVEIVSPAPSPEAKHVIKSPGRLTTAVGRWGGGHAIWFSGWDILDDPRATKLLNHFAAYFRASDGIPEPITDIFEPMRALVAANAESPKPE